MAQRAGRIAEAAEHRHIEMTAADDPERDPEEAETGERERCRHAL